MLDDTCASRVAGGHGKVQQDLVGVVVTMIGSHLLA